MARREPSIERMRGALTQARERELLTYAEIAARYKLQTPENARKWLRRHRVPMFGKVGRTVRYDARDIDAAFRRSLRSGRREAA